MLKSHTLVILETWNVDRICVCLLCKVINNNNWIIFHGDSKIKQEEIWYIQNLSLCYSTNDPEDLHCYIIDLFEWDKW
jgi:hypothetical protein